MDTVWLLHGLLVHLYYPRHVLSLYAKHGHQFVSFILKQLHFIYSHCYFSILIVLCGFDILGYLGSSALGFFGGVSYLVHADYWRGIIKQSRTLTESFYIEICVQVYYYFLIETPKHRVGKFYLSMTNQTTIKPTSTHKHRPEWARRLRENLSDISQTLIPSASYVRKDV